MEGSAAIGVKHGVVSLEKKNKTQCCDVGLPGSNLFEVCTHNDHYIMYTPGQPFSINPGDGLDFVGIPVDQHLKKSDPPTTVIKWPRRLVFSGTGSRLKVRQ